MSAQMRATISLEDPILHIDYGSDERSVQGFGEMSPSVLASVFRASPDCIKILSADGALQFMNRNGQCAMEIDDFAPLKDQDWCSLWPAEARARIDSSVRRAARGESSRFEAFCPTAKGTPRWWDVTTTPITDAQDRVVQIMSISRDITSIKQRELNATAYASDLEDDLVLKDEMITMQGTLMREIDHRVRNSLSMIASLLGVHSAISENSEVRAALENSANRVKTVAQLHELLYQGNRLDRVNVGNYLCPLADHALQSVGREQIELVKEIAPVELNFEDATAIGLISAETILNALRHGFADSGQGRVRVAFRQMPSGQCQLEIENSVGALPAGFDPSQAKGLGLKVINIYAQQLGGEYRMKNLPHGGVTCTLEFTPSAVSVDPDQA